MYPELLWNQSINYTGLCNLLIFLSCIVLQTICPVLYYRQFIDIVVLYCTIDNRLCKYLLYVVLESAINYTYWARSFIPLLHIIIPCSTITICLTLCKCFTVRAGVFRTIRTNDQCRCRIVYQYTHVDLVLTTQTLESDLGREVFFILGNRKRYGSN